ncbi:Ig-like domain-containing protein [Actinomycetota bacterium]
MKRKLYIGLPILIIISLFSFAALCNSGQDQSDKEASDLAIEKKAQEKLENEETSFDPSSASKEAEAGQKIEDDSKDNSTKDATEDEVTGKEETPTISLKIYEGPTYSKSDDVCYYRIEATVTGAPDPSIKFSRDDSSGAWGSKKVQINLKRGESYTLTATATNSEGKATNSIKLDWGCDGTNHNPVIAGIGISANDLYTLNEYEISTAATDPDGDSLTYKWSVDGGVLNNPSINPTKWETPGFPETYHITVEVSDGKGGKDTETRAVRVEELVIIGGSPPEIQDIIIYTNPIYTDKRYDVFGKFTDPDNDIDGFFWDISGGTIVNPSANRFIWATPKDPGDYSISLVARDKQGNEDMLVVFFKVENE